MQAPLEDDGPVAAVPLAPAPAVSEPESDDVPELHDSIEEIQRELGIPALSAPWKGDLDGMRERRVIRVLTVYGLGRYFLDGGQEKGLTYEMFRLRRDDPGGAGRTD